VKLTLPDDKTAFPVAYGNTYLLPFFFLQAMY